MKLCKCLSNAEEIAGKQVLSFDEDDCITKLHLKNKNKNCSLFQPEILLCAGY
jgi:hypothetical protein